VASTKQKISQTNLVGGFNPFEKYYSSQNGNLPQIGVKIKISETTNQKWS